jgi:hypothetical protein
MRTGMGSMFRKLCRWEVGGASGMVTDDSEKFRLENLKSELVGASEVVLYVGSVITCVAVESTPENCVFLLFFFCLVVLKLRVSRKLMNS